MTIAKIKCVKVKRPECGNQWCLYRLDKPYSLNEEFDGSEVGDTITCEYCEMTEEEIAALPEFEGW